MDFSYLAVSVGLRKCTG